MGTGVMIGAGIFALTGQVAEYAGQLVPAAFLIAAMISAFNTYTYIKMSNKYPSAGGIAMILHKAYGRSAITGACALLMAFSMIINEILVARTFGTYTLQLFDAGENDRLIPALAVFLIVIVFLLNLAGNKYIGAVSKVTAVLKVWRHLHGGYCNHCKVVRIAGERLCGIAHACHARSCWMRWPSGGSS